MYVYIYVMGPIYFYVTVSHRLTYFILSYTLHFFGSISLSFFVYSFLKHFIVHAYVAIFNFLTTVINMKVFFLHDMKIGKIDSIHKVFNIGTMCIQMQNFI